MKVILLNGSPNKDGCTKRALIEISNTLNKNGIDTEIIEIGSLSISGCLDCGACRSTGECVFNDIVNEVNKKLENANGLVIGSPVYYASANGTLISFLDRLFHSSKVNKQLKVGASVVSARRSGTTASFDILNKYFTIANMPVVSSTYWNNVHGFTKEDTEKDKEGLQTMRNLALNMAFLIKAIEHEKEKTGLPKLEREYFTSFFD
ncbi:flavodoxin family protein [bacterium]|nr:flavodoxin family protein [bacterium]